MNDEEETALPPKDQGEQKPVLSVSTTLAYFLDKYQEYDTPENRRATSVD